MTCQKASSYQIETIVLQHHERPNGSGFPNNTKVQELTPLSCLFILAHDLVDYIFEYNDQWSFKGFVETYKDEYKDGLFSKIVQKLIELK